MGCRSGVLPSQTSGMLFRNDDTEHRSIWQGWAGLFARVPDIEARVPQAVENGDVIWSGWEMSGTTVGGTPQLMRGVVIVRTEGGRASQTSFHLDPVAQGLGDVVIGGCVQPVVDPDAGGAPVEAGEAVHRQPRSP